jgi:diadenylate cyclase
VQETLNIGELIEQIKWIPSFDIKLVDTLQIVILAFALYYLAKSLYKTRAWILVKGLLIIGAVYLVICLTSMTVLRTLMEGLFGTLMIAIIIMLQPELQRIVELIGKRKFTDFKSLIMKKTEVATWYSEKTIYEIAAACEAMGQVQTGALIVIERGIPLTEYIDSGIDIDGSISSQLLINTFEKNTPLHDGAVIIKENKIASATCYLPLSTNNSIDKNLGTRHRAALGISENSDCVVIIVSEETGAISFCSDGILHHNVDRNELSQLLRGKMKKNDEKIFETRRSKSPIWMKILAPILSVIIWMSVLSTSDPVITKIVTNIPVETINTDVLDDIGQTYTIQSGNTINVKVQGRRSLVDAMTKNDFVAIADFTEMSIVYAVPINISPTTPYNDVEIVAQYNDVMKLELEEIIQTEIPIEVKVVGDADEDYVVALKDIEVETLVVTCPQSIAKTLDKAVLTIDAYGKDNTFVANAQPVIYDKNGEELPSNKLSLNKGTVRVTMDVHEVVEMPLVITLKEQNLSGDAYYVLDWYKAETEVVRVAADNDIITDIQSLNIVIDPDAGAESIGTILINIRQYLPDGMQLAKNQVEQISIDVELTKYQKMTLNLTPSIVKVTGFDANLLTCSVIGVTPIITLYYNTSLVDPNTVTVKMLNPTIKTIENTPGEYQGAVTFTDIEGVLIAQELIARYSLAEKRD